MTDEPAEIPTASAEPSGNDFARFWERFERARRSGERTEPLESEAKERFGERGEDVLSALIWLSRVQDYTARPKTPDSRATVRLDSSVNAISFGRFRVMERLGVGGSGVVFRVFDPQEVREAALKLPRGDILWEPERERRFLQEARAAELLDHPQIVPIYEAGKIGTINYILSEYCPGPNLAQWLSDQQDRGYPTSFRLAAQWMSLLADAVDYAHRAGVVHRDLKPGNVLLVPDDSKTSADGYLAEEAFRPKITDFGLAKFAMEVSTLTRTGTVLGTLPYLAPEQVQGRVAKATPALDIYSLGAVLYEFLGGRAPVVGKDEFDVLRKIGVEEPTPLHELRSDVPRELAAICAKCLEWNPARRYHRGADLKHDLERYLRGEPVSARSVGKPRRLWRKFVRARTPGWTLLATGFLLFCLGIGSWIYYGRATRNATRLLRTVEDVSKEKSELKEIVEAQRDQIEQVYADDMQHAWHFWSASAALNRDNSRTASEMKDRLLRHVPGNTVVDPRGFEWNYLWRLCDPERFAQPLSPLGEFVGHVGSVYQIGFSRSGRTLITCGADKTIRFWDVASRRLLQTLVGHTDEVNGFALSADEKQLASVSDDRTVRIWNCETGSQQEMLSGHRAKVVAVAFDRDCRRLLTGDDEGGMKYWDLEQRAELVSFMGHAGRVQSIFRIPPGFPRGPVSGSSEFLSASTDATTKHWQLEPTSHQTPAPPRTIRFRGPLDFSRPGPDLRINMARPMNLPGRSSVTVGGEGRPERVAYRTQDAITAGLFEANQTQAILAGRNCPLSVIDFATSKHWHVTNEPRFIWAMGFSPDGRYLVTGEQNGRLMLWDHSVTAHQTLLPGAGENTNVLEFSADGRWMAVGTQRAHGDPESAQPTLVVWELRTGPSIPHDLSQTAERRFRSHFACFSPDSTRLAVASEAEGMGWYARVFSVGDFRLIREWRLSDPNVVQLGYSPDGGRLWIAQQIGGVLQVVRYDADTGQTLSNVEIAGGFAGLPHEECCRAGRGDQFVLRTQDAVAIYDPFADGPNEGQPTSRIPLPFTPVSAIAYDAASGLLALGGANEKVQVVRCSDGAELGRFELGGRAAIRSLAFGNGGRRLIAVADGDRGAFPELYSLQKPITKLCSLRLPYFADGTSRIAFSPDGNSAAASFWYTKRYSDQPAPTDMPDQTAVILWKTTGREAPSLGRNP